MNKVYEEFGKFFLNVSVALIIFVFVKPLVEGDFNALVGFIFAVVILLLLIFAYLLLKKAGDIDERK